MAKGLYIGVLELTNLCPAIDGANGFTVSGGGTIESSSAHTKYSTNALKLNAIEGKAEVCAASQTTIPLNPEHIYYARVEAYQEAAYGAVEIYWPIAEPHMFNLSVKSGRTWNLYSVVTDRASFNAGNYSFRLDFNSMHNNYINSSIWYDGWMIIDLTEAFGSGKEPSKEWCDENIPYFVGTKALQVRNLNGVARKVKKAYISVDKNYIESDGNQYIDTGFKATSNTRVVFEGYNLSAGSSWTFGTWKGSTSLQYAFSCNKDWSFRYGSNNVKLDTVPVGKLEVDFNKNSYNLNGVTGTLPEEEFSCDYSIYLFAINAKGSVSSGKYTGRVYSCKIYDNDILVRDYIPALKDGVYCLYDTVENKYYYNQGTGSFKGDTTIEVARKIKKGYIGVGGVARPFFSSEKKLEYYGNASNLSSVLHYHASAEIGDYALFAGGSISGTADSKLRSTVNTYDKNLVKSTATALSTKRSDLAGASNSKYAIFSGGYYGSTVNTVDAYDSNLVRTVPEGLSVKLYEHLGARAGDYVVFAGGKQSNASSVQNTVVNAYDSNLVRKSEIEAAGAHLYGATTTLNDYAIFAGGYTKGASVHTYDSNLVHTQIESLTRGRYWHTGGTIGNHAIFGGGEASIGKVSDVEAYDSNLVKTVNLSSLSLARIWMTSISTQDYFIIAGGKGDSTVGIVETFNNDLLLGTQTPLTTPRTYAKGAKVGHYILIAGGDNSSGDPINTTEAYIEL